MPGTDEVKRGISRSQAANIDDTRQAAICHEHIARYQIAVGHDVSASTSGRCPQSSPHPAKSRHIQPSLAAREAGFHPLVLGRQLTSAPRAAEGPAASADGPNIADELGKIMSKGDRLARVSVGSDAMKLT